MSYTFDGVNKLCILGVGVTLDVKDMYSRWKDWVVLTDNSKFTPFLSVVGGDPTVGANAIANYFFVLNGWKIRPYEASHTLTVDGILNVDGGAGGDPFTDTIGNWRVRIVQIVPMQAETISVSSEGGLTSAQNDMLLALASIHGLIKGTPLVVGGDFRTAGNVVQSISQAGEVVTISRS